MADKRSPTGYKRPPKHSRFKKGKSGNPSGRPKRSPNFLEDAATILNAPITGQANGKSITLPMIQAMFRRLCRNALNGDKAALRRAIDLILNLKPEPHQQCEKTINGMSVYKRQLAIRLGINPDSLKPGPSKPNPTTVRLRKQADALAKEERKRLILEAKNRGIIPE